VQDAELKDITIIGGGPTGLFAAFYAGMRSSSVRIIDSLPELGGQLSALYPEKYVYDVGGFPRILARDLAKNLIDQGLQFGAETVLEEQVNELVREDGHLVVTTDKGRYPTKAVLIAAGVGAFSPRTLECPGDDALTGKGIAYHVKDPAQYQDKTILVVGGGDSAVDWVLNLKDRTKRLVLIHRREGFRAHAHSKKLMEQAVAAGQMELWTHKEVRRVDGDVCVRSVTVFDNRTNEETTVDVDAVIALIGFKPDLGPIANWGLTIEKHSIVVNQKMETGVPGVYAAGDIATYEGKLALIATGFGEACMAINHAVHEIDPKARYNPGHSTNLKVFKAREDAESAGETDA
jgi:thioredoxin reductase